jgi:hypothetical protein
VASGPEEANDRDFSRTLVARALAAVDSDLDAPQRALFTLILERGEPGELQALSKSLAMTPEALRQRLHRLRRRLAANMREEVAALTADPDRVDEELRAIRGALRGD